MSEVNQKLRNRVDCTVWQRVRAPRRSTQAAAGRTHVDRELNSALVGEHLGASVRAPSKLAEAQQGVGSPR